MPGSVPLEQPHDDYSYLHGKCGRAQRDPLNLVLEYDGTTDFLRLLGA